MAVILTDRAAQRVKNILAKEGRGLALRLGVKKSGCSGMAYTFEIAEAISEGDGVFEHNGAKVLVNADALAYLDGAILDYVKEGLKEEFKYTNPKEINSCGCGESVSFK